MKIYTKQGDKGTTSLANGTRVAKTDNRIEAIGTIDELNSWVGLLIDELQEDTHRKQLTKIQQDLFYINAIIAQYKSSDNNKIQQRLFDQVSYFEKEIDDMQYHLQPLNHFILYGGHIIISHIHMARSICRRAERRVVAIDIDNILPEVLIYFNRLNDYLFVFARYVAIQLKVEEKFWIPKL